RPCPVTPVSCASPAAACSCWSSGARRERRRPRSRRPVPRPARRRRGRRARPPPILRPPGPRAPSRCPRATRRRSSPTSEPGVGGGEGVEQPPPGGVHVLFGPERQRGRVARAQQGRRLTVLIDHAGAVVLIAERD